MNSVKPFFFLMTVALGASLLSTATQAGGQTFGLAGKRLDDPNFVAAWRGCAEAAREAGDECIHIGAPGAASSRNQAQAISEALQSKSLAAIAISVTSSPMIARAVQTAGMPIITFDSPFSETDTGLSQAYVGTDNEDFGRELARAAKRLHPQGGTLCIMTADRDRNLAQRVHGVRSELSGLGSLPEGQRLNGEGGWTELARCPWNSADDVARTMNELSITLNHLKPDVFISVGHWPIIDAAAYRKVVAPSRAALEARRPLMIVAVGKIMPEFVALMNEQLVHGYVSIDFERIGRACYRLMRSAVDHVPVPAVTYDPPVVRMAR